MDALLMQEQCSSCMMDVCSVINRSLVRSFYVVVHEYVAYAKETEPQVIVAMLNQCSSYVSLVLFGGERYY